MTAAPLPLKLLLLLFVAQSGYAQTSIAASAQESSRSAKSSSLVISVSGDGHHDRFAVLDLAHDKWRFQNINWSSPDTRYGLSAFLLGREFKLRNWLKAVVLAGPWWSYENHSWNELVLATHFTLQAKRMRLGLTNFWGAPAQLTGEYFDSHSQTVTGLPKSPNWLGVSFLEKHSTDGLERLFMGPTITKRCKSVSASVYPYWDFRSGTSDIRLGLSYSREKR